MKPIFRIEHESFENDRVFAGPYGVSGIASSTDWADELTNGHNDDNHPTPLRDKKLKHINKWEGKYYCGFTSERRLLKWFSKKELRKLKARGFVVVKYLAKEKQIIKGDKQDLFIPAKGHAREIINLSSKRPKKRTLKK